MKTRIVLMIAVWASLAVGAVTLFEAAAVPVAIVSGLALSALAVQAVVGVALAASGTAVVRCPANSSSRSGPAGCCSRRRAWLCRSLGRARA